MKKKGSIQLSISTLLTHGLLKQKSSPTKISHLCSKVSILLRILCLFYSNSFKALNLYNIPEKFKANSSFKANCLYLS